MRTARTRWGAWSSNPAQALRRRQVTSSGARAGSCPAPWRRT
jgi:hypothetical protein